MDVGLHAYGLLSPPILKQSTISLVQAEHSDESTCQVSPDIAVWTCGSVPEQRARYKSQAFRVADWSKVAAEP